MDVNVESRSRLNRVFEVKLRNVLLQIFVLFLAFRFAYLPINGWVAAQGGFLVIHEIVTSLISTALTYIFFMILLVVADEVLYKYGYR
jgi:hypothetical protein